MSRDARQLPNPVGAELAVLGQLQALEEPDRVLDVGAVLAPSDFYRVEHQRLFALFLDMAEKGQAPTSVAVTERIIREDRAQFYGSLTFAGGLADHAPSTENLDQNVEIVAEASRFRRLVFSMLEVVDEAYKGELTSAELLAQAQERLNALQAATPASTLVHLGQVSADALQLLRAKLTGRHAPIVSTGYPSLDRLLVGGLAPKRFLILAGRPGMGKTSLGLAVAYEVCRQGIPAAVFSLEMPSLELVQRLQAAEARVPLAHIVEGRTNREEWERLVEADAQFAAAPLFLDDQPGLSVHDIRARVRRLKARYPGLGLVVVDHVGLMGDALNSRSATREQQVGASSRQLKALSKQLDLCVLGLCQLNRAVEGRKDKRPQLSELRESGSLEQDADAVLFVYRDDYYHKASEDRHLAEIIVAKQRGGPTDTAYLYFRGSRTLFLDIEVSHARAS